VSKCPDCDADHILVKSCKEKPCLSIYDGPEHHCDVCKDAQFREMISKEAEQRNLYISFADDDYFTIIVGEEKNE
jgi:hypothetical protein